MSSVETTERPTELVGIFSIGAVEKGTKGATAQVVGFAIYFHFAYARYTGPFPAFVLNFVCIDQTGMPFSQNMQVSKPTIKNLLACPPSEIIAFLAGIYEHSSWVAEALVSDDPASLSLIGTVSQLAAAMKTIVDQSSHERKLALLQAHPDLCEKVGKLHDLTQESQEEQSRSGLQSLTETELAQFNEWNTAYRTKCGFPFILAVRNATKQTVLSALQGRVRNTAETEFVTALTQVHKIAWMRLLAVINADDAAGYLTCHVLDTASGCPAAGMRIDLHRLSPPAEAGLVGTFFTNDDGRLDGPALKGGTEFRVGVYEWTFYAGDYFAKMGTCTPGQPFLDVIPLRFGIDNPDDHYHVPLLVSPWSFSTYRGS